MVILYREFSNPESDTELNVDATAFILNFQNFKISAGNPFFRCNYLVLRAK
jgi:hypothetical protein